MKLSEKISSAKRPYVIAGPCSAETEEQVMHVCQEIASTGSAQLFRAGIWKPRTRPDSFEGLGEKALPWIVSAGKATGLPTTVEVANKRHVEQALKAGVDVLWVGARTTVNPFAVQELADALRGTETSVMIKNPVNPDVQLWMGAFERFAKAGLTDLSAVHRGFSVYNHPKYRNVPNWELPILLKENMPEIPLICDPSHITGNRELLLEVSQKAMDLSFEGLMIETHPNPVEAWSDAAQQITPEHLKRILDSLVLRTSELSTDIASQIEKIRVKVSTLDDHLFDLLSERMLLSEGVGKLKRENNITILQQEHWSNLIQKRLEDSSEYNLNRTFVRQLMDAIHQESIRHQTAVMNPEKKN
jgi:chorismate mutase